MHLVETVNQNDQAVYLDGVNKIDEPMIQITLTQDRGKVTGFVMPGFRERTFMGRDARLRGDLAIAGDDASYDFNLEECAVDLRSVKVV